jgi:iron complex transport system substrate-binding protein
VLQRLQQHVERLGFAASRADVDAQIATLGEWTGTRERAAQLVTTLHQRIGERVATLQPRLQGKKAVFLGSNGVAFGRGTLQDDFLQSMGLRNIASEAGINGPSKLRLELLVAAQPDFVISEPRGDLDREQAHPLLLHPALQRLHPRQLMLADRWFDCAGPWLADAYAALAAQVMTP